MQFKSVALPAVAMLFSAQAFAHEYEIGDLMIDHPVVRATPPGAKVAGGYLLIVNSGKSDDRLLGGTADFAGKTEVHEMKMENDVMKMQALPDGLPVPAGETVSLKPGGYHVMFMDLKQQLKIGEKHKVMLTFEKAGKVEVTFQTKSIAATMEMKNEAGN